MAFEKALSLISGGGSGGGFTPAELVMDGNKQIVKATPETIDSVFVAVGHGSVLYRTFSENGNDGAYAVFMGNITGTTVTAEKFDYDETAGGYVRAGDILG